MAFFELFAHAITSLLVGYLALTNTLAGSIERLLGEKPLPAHETTAPVEEWEPEDSPAFSSLGTVSDALPRVLIENSAFQQAAVTASGETGYEIALDPNIPLETQVKDALVNVFCQFKTEDYIRTTTGTGFFISPKGVILTNAHVAQFLLLRDLDDSILDARCVIRSGDPATPKYEAELLYLSPAWVAENAALITTESPRGTGERDYALLYISRSVTEEPLPARFPALPIDITLLPRSLSGTNVITAGYPAEALLRDGARARLAPKAASTTVGELYTFGSNYADIFSVSNSAVGQHGASGGPVVRPSSGVIGLVVTKGNEETEGTQSLRALTLSYVDRTIVDETGFSLALNMRGDVAYRGKIFNSALAPFLTKLLSFEFEDQVSTD
jgi:hypothetical protein